MGVIRRAYLLLLTQGITQFDGHSLVQVKREMWQGEFVDFDDSDTIPHKAIVRVVQSVSIQ